MSYPELTEFSQFYRKFGGFFASLRKWLMIIDISSFHHPFFLTLKLTYYQISYNISNFEYSCTQLKKIGSKSGNSYIGLLGYIHTYSVGCYVSKICHFWNTILFSQLYSEYEPFKKIVHLDGLPRNQLF